MKKIVIILNVIIALYFFVFANIYFWGSFLALFTGAVANKPEILKNAWMFVINILIAPFLIYGSIIFFRKTERKYTYGLILLSLIWAGTQICRFFFITNHKLEKADLTNSAFFGISILLVYLTKYLNRKSQQ
jgi:hypothetical protein